MLTTQQQAAYLERIGCGSRIEVSAACLDELVFAHQRTVPFETCVIALEGQTPSLALEDLFEKIVVSRRGGYCFELNKLFEALLVSLGFDARPVLCRAVERTGRSPINHRGILVEVDGESRFVDVGYGGPMPAGALVMRDEETQDIRGDLFTPRRVDESWWAVDRVTKSKEDFFDDDIPSRRQTELEFCVAEVEDFDFDLLNVALSQPGQLFSDHLIANLRTERGHIALMDDVLTIREDGEKRRVELDWKAGVRDVLSDYFGLRFTF